MDLIIFQEKGEFYAESIRKSIVEDTREDSGELLEQYPQLLVVLADKGYEGICEFTKAMLPKNKSRN